MQLSLANLFICRVGQTSCSQAQASTAVNHMREVQNFGAPCFWESPWVVQNNEAVTGQMLTVVAETFKILAFT